MEITKDNLLIRATYEGINNDHHPALIEIIDLPSEKTICQIKAVNKPSQGADGDLYPFITFKISLGYQL